MLRTALICLLALGVTSVNAEEGKKEMNALSFEMKTLDGKEVALSKYEGKVILVVNVASRCGYTPQYAQLQSMHKKYADKGLVVLGVPCNQFGGQEPGTSKDIQSFCSTNYGVTFDMLEKVDVNGDDACDFYKYLTDQETEPKEKGPVRWNFEKFVINRKGEVAGRFSSSVKPDGAELVELIEKSLGESDK